MSVANLEQFVEMIGKSGLIPKDQLQPFLSQHDTLTENPAELSDSLVEAGLLTCWQRDKLLEGKHRGFFLGKYKILEALGAGGMGRVYLAEHRVMRHRVAIKTMAKRRVGNEAYLRRFEQEARAAAAVVHPRVVRAFDFDSGPDLYYLVMEYVDGEDLQKIIDRDGIMPIPIAAECIRQVAEGLEAIHNAGLVHRDIKPGNLIVDRQGNVRILDLGLARINEEESSSLTLLYDAKMMGTVDYLAPEQARNSHAVDHRADLYSLGCTFYFLLTGHPPFVGGTSVERIIDHQIKPPVDVREIRAEVPTDLAHLCHKLMAKKPDDRIQTAAEVVAAMADWLPRHDEVPRVDPSPTSSPNSLNAEREPTQVRRRQNSDQELTLAVDGNDTKTQSGSSALASPLPRGTENPRAAAGSTAKANRTAKSGHGSMGKLNQASLAKTPAVAEKVAHSAEVSLLEILPPLPSGSDPLNSPDLFSTPLETLPDPLQAKEPTWPPSMMPATASKPKQESTVRWSEMVQRLVATQGSEGVSYALWFLVASGLLIGILVCVVGYSYVQSTQGIEVPRNRSSEDAGQVFPAQTGR